MLIDMNRETIDKVLRSEIIGRLGCYADGEIYVVPITYVIDEAAMIVHSGDGKKMEMMRKNPNVCVEVEQLDGPESWRSVIVWGKFRELAGEEAERRNDNLFRELAIRSGARAILEGSAGQREALKSKMHLDNGLLFEITIDRATGRAAVA